MHRTCNAIITDLLRLLILGAGVPKATAVFKRGEKLPNLWIDLCEDARDGSQPTRSQGIFAFRPQWIWFSSQQGRNSFISPIASLCISYPTSRASFGRPKAAQSWRNSSWVFKTILAASASSRHCYDHRSLCCELVKVKISCFILIPLSRFVW